MKAFWLIDSYFGVIVADFREEARRNMMRTRILMILKRRLTLTSKILTPSRFPRPYQLQRRRMSPLLPPVTDQMTILR